MSESYPSDINVDDVKSRINGYLDILKNDLVLRKEYKLKDYFNTLLNIYDNLYFPKQTVYQGFYNKNIKLDTIRLQAFIKHKELVFSDEYIVNLLLDYLEYYTKSRDEYYEKCDIERKEKEERIYRENREDEKEERERKRREE